MPVVFRYKGFRFFFYSNEGSPREPVHVLVRAGNAEAKLWLEPQVRVAYSTGFDAATLRELAARHVPADAYVSGSRRPPPELLMCSMRSR